MNDEPRKGNSGARENGEVLKVSLQEGAGLWWRVLPEEWQPVRMVFLWRGSSSSDLSPCTLAAVHLQTRLFSQSLPSPFRSAYFELSKELPSHSSVQGLCRPAAGGGGGSPQNSQSGENAMGPTRAGES